MPDNTIKPRNKVKIKITKEITTAFIGKINEEKVVSSKTYEYTFSKDYKSKTDKEKKALAKIIFTSETKSKKLNKTDKRTTKKKITSVLTKDSYKKGDTIQIPLIKRKISFTKLDEAELYDEVYIIVQSKGLETGETIVELRQGDKEELELEGVGIYVQHNNTNVKEIKEKIGNFSKDESIENKDDFKDWSIAKIKLAPKNETKLKLYRKFLKDATDKKANLYLLVKASVSGDSFTNTFYNEVHGKIANRWYDGDADGVEWFGLKKKDCCKSKLPKEIIKKIATSATDDNIKNNINGLNLAFKDSSINTCLRRLHFLAQVIHESGGFRYTREIGVLNSSYSGFPGRGLIQLTGKTNYTNYGLFAKEDVTSTLENKKKLEADPHAAKSAGWFWDNNANLNDDADNNDFIYITRIINGGFNGYNDRLKYVKNGFKELYDKCSNEIDEKAEYKFKDSKAYDDKRASFAWGLWHDPDLSKNGCTKNKTKAIEGYKRLVELTTSNFSATNWYGIKSISNFSTIKYSVGEGKDIKYYVKVRKAAELRIKELEK